MVMKFTIMVCCITSGLYAQDMPRCVERGTQTDSGIEHDHNMRFLRKVYSFAPGKPGWDLWQAYTQEQDEYRKFQLLSAAVAATQTRMTINPVMNERRLNRFERN